MHRRGAGVAAIKNKNLAQARYKDKGSEIASDQLSQLSRQMEAFRSNLEEFATKHREEIRRNPQFRAQFQQMCAAIGVDPLASSKGFWSKMLGVGDFYYELGVQIIEVCIAASHRSGGLMTLDKLHERLKLSRGRNKQDISNDDILMAIRKLKTLGNGFALIPLGGGEQAGRYLVQSIPGELTLDHTTVLQEAEDYMLTEGLAWLDEQSSKDKLYWFPGLFMDR